MTDPSTIGTSLGALLAAAYAAFTSRRTHRDITPNGESLNDLLHRIIEFEAYSHTRNHDILNALTRIELFLQTELK